MTSLIKISDSRAALSVGSVGRLPYVAAACLVAILGLQAGSRVASLGDGAFGLMWGDSDSADAATWRPNQAADLPRKGFVEQNKAPKAQQKIVNESIASLREGSAVIPKVRRGDVSEYVRYLRSLAERAREMGIPTARLDKRTWRASVISAGPFTGVSIHTPL